MTPLEKTLKREVTIDGRAFIVAISPEGIKLTLKGKRNGQELKWQDLVSGEAALAVALNASLGGFVQPKAKAILPKAVLAPPATPALVASPARLDTAAIPASPLTQRSVKQKKRPAVQKVRHR